MRVSLRAATVAAIVIALGFGSVSAQTPNSIVIEKPFSRETPGNSKVAAGYMTITNKGGSPDRLLSASSPVAGKVEIHEMTMQDNVMKMRELPNGITIDSGKSVSLAPGGNHLMLKDLNSILKKGGKIPVTLNFEKAGKVNATLEVQAIGAQQPDGMKMPSGHQMHKM